MTPPRERPCVCSAESKLAGPKHMSSQLRVRPPGLEDLASGGMERSVSGCAGEDKGQKGERRG